MTNTVSTFEIGKWYKNHTYPGSFFKYTGEENDHSFIGKGCNYGGEFYSEAYWCKSDSYELATEEEVRLLEKGEQPLC